MTTTSAPSVGNPQPQRTAPRRSTASPSRRHSHARRLIVMSTRRHIKCPSAIESMHQRSGPDFRHGVTQDQADDGFRPGSGKEAMGRTPVTSVDGTSPSRASAARALYASQHSGHLHSDPTGEPSASRRRVRRQPDFERISETLASLSGRGFPHPTQLSPSTIRASQTLHASVGRANTLRDL